MKRTAGVEIERLIQLLAKLPGLGPRSARRAALYLIKNREKLLSPLSLAMADAQDKVKVCSTCGNVDTIDPCTICSDPRRDRTLLCVVEEVGAMEGIRPEDLAINHLIERAAVSGMREVVLATNATVEGQTTAHYITERLKGLGLSTSKLAHGVPVGGELDYLDEGTLTAALRARTAI